MNLIHPPHYQGFSNDAEPIDIAENLTFNGGNALKYIARACRIDGEVKGDPCEDLNKAIFYLLRELNRLDPAGHPMINLIPGTAESLKLTPHDVLQMMTSELADMRRDDYPLAATEFAYHVHNLSEALGENDD
ncbi:DUF3310 domain-containing protein [Corynebacterium diphtheriae]|uniref:DUF3310 domain-containing protein n=1 Tax=Corynebacterium diphtheriae TaxID=1717 RepID=UPI000B4AFA63|nr:DUF3310 domain-containing protein [Corynebacterium diphtheriae]CAB1006011.1 hypothetical protein FRC0508_01949 [Corynebacterium diphtheriae]